MSEILTINGQKVDLTPNTVNRNLQINDIGEVKDRQANFSNTIKIPKTPRNIKILDFVSVAGNQSIAPYRKLPCTYTVDGIPLITNGYAIIKSTNTHFECVIYDGIIELAERIKGKKLNELNFSDLNHYFTDTTLSDSTTNTEGYIYALAEFFTWNSYSEVKLHEQAPSLFVKTLWDKIFQEAGFRYSGNFFTTNTDFQAEVITPVKGYPLENLSVTSTSMGQATTNNIFKFVKSKDPRITLEDQFTITSNSITGLTVNSDGSIIANSYTKLKLSLNIDYENFDCYVEFRVKINGVIKSILILPQTGTNLVSDINLALEAGDVLTFTLYGTYGSSQNGADEFIVNYSAQAIIDAFEQTGGQFIDFATFTSDMDQLTFLKDVMQRYGLILRPVRNADSYEFIQLEELLNNAAGVDDWSIKLNRIIEEDYSTPYARENIATYNYPEGTELKEYDGSITIDNETLDSSKTLFTSPYEIANKKVRQLNGQDIYSSIIWEDKEQDGVTIRANKETKVKIFRVNKVNSTVETRYFDDINTVTLTGDIPYLSLNNMGMQYFLDQNYASFKMLINRSNKITIECFFTPVDIYNLDFLKLKYLKQTGRYYYLNKVKHSPGKLSKVELIQLNHSF